MHELIKGYMEKGFAGKSDDTKKTYLSEIEQFNKWLIPTGTDIENFSRLDVQQYINWLTAKKKAPTTINKKFRAISHFCKFNNIEENVANIRVISPDDLTNMAPKSLERNERNQMLREVTRNGSKRDIAVIYTLLNTGVRVSECSNLQLSSLSDIGDKKGFLKVTGKGFKARTVPINSECRFTLNEYLKERGIDMYNLKSLTEEELNQPLFLSNFNKPLSKESIQRIVKKFGNTHPHTLRHTFATILMREKKADPTTVAQLLGHSNLNTVQRYTKATEAELQNIVEGLNFD